eukprot:1269444-Prorocentrum_lima.AAC.1
MAARWRALCPPSSSSPTSPLRALCDAEALEPSVLLTGADPSLLSAMLCPCSLFSRSLSFFGQGLAMGA